MSDFEKLKRAFEAATTGPWEDKGDGHIYGVDEDGSYLVCDVVGDPEHVVNEQGARDAGFIALAYNLMPVLLEAHERAAQLEKAMAVIAERDGDYTQNIVNDALYDVGYYSNDDKEA